MNLRRGPWEELALRDVTDVLVLFCPGWTNDRETLILPIREVGWFATSAEAWRAAESADLKWGWIGTDDAGELVVCQQDGLVPDTGEIVSDVQQVTLALVPSSSPETGGDDASWPRNPDWHH